MSNIQVRITRDSVCIADDMQDHKKTLKIALQNDVSTTIYNIAKEYLPNVAGQGHSWSCFINGENVALIDGNCIEITSITNAPNLSDESEIHFKYHSAV